MVSVLHIIIIWLALIVHILEGRHQRYSKIGIVEQIPDSSSQALFDVESLDAVDCTVYCLESAGCDSVYYLRTNGSCRGYSQLTLQKVNFTLEDNVYQFIVNKPGLGCVESGYTSFMLNDGSSMCIKLYADEADWNISRKLCQAEDADLAILDTDEKISLVAEYIRSLYNWQRWWVGLTDVEDEGKWRWIDNSLLHVSSSRQSFPGKSAQNCGILRAHNDGTLTDSSCKHERKRVCEK